MIVKPSISFLNSDNDAQLITNTSNITTALTGNASYPTPAPTLAAVTIAKNGFVTAVANAADGGLALTAIKNDKRVALVALLRQLASYVQVTCNGDMAVLLTSGFPLQKPSRTPIGVLQPPASLTVTLGARTGELVAAAAPVNGAAIYNWRVTTAAAPNAVVQTDQTTAARTTFDNLTPGVVYNVQANVVGSAGPSDWTDPISQMVV
jgi:hypothetical protein